MISRRNIFITCLVFVLSQQIVKAQNGNSDYQYALIEAVKQKNLGNLQGAIELYKMVLNENDSVAVAYYELGTLYAITNQLNDAEINYRKAVEIEPGVHWYFDAYLDILVMREKYIRAADYIKRSLKNVGNQVEYRFKLANIYFLDGKNKKAIKLLNSIEKE